MNNSFARLVDGMCATLRSEVLTRLDDDFARGQVFGVINLLNTFKVRADWSAGFLLQQIAAQQLALQAVRDLAQGHGALPAGPATPDIHATPVAELLAARDAGNTAIAAWLQWLDTRPGTLAADTASQIEQLLRTAMRAEVDLELKHSPRPLFAQMSSGRDD